MYLYLIHCVRHKVCDDHGTWLSSSSRFGVAVDDDVECGDVAVRFARGDPCYSQ